MTMLFNIANDALLHFLAVITDFKQIDRVHLKLGFGCKIMHSAAACESNICDVLSVESSPERHLKPDLDVICPRGRLAAELSACQA